MHMRKKYANDSCFVLSYCGLIPANITHIFQGYFTGIGAMRDCPIASEVILKNMGKWRGCPHYELIT